MSERVKDHLNANANVLEESYLNLNYFNADTNREKH